MKVAALYIDPRGPYPKLLGPDMFGRDVDAFAREFSPIGRVK